MWTALVAVEQERARLRAEFWRHAERRAATLARAIDDGGWDRSVALEFLAGFPDDVPELLDRLIPLSISHGWAGAVRAALTVPYRMGDLPGLDRDVLARLDAADDDEFRRLAELLDHLRAWTALAELVERAAGSPDPNIRAVADDF